MAAKSLISLLTVFFCSILLGSAVNAQIPEELPIDDSTRAYLEALSPEKQAAIIEIFQRGIKGKTPASPAIIERQELKWSYGQSPPVYPSPPGKGVGEWAHSFQKAAAIVAQMTDDEKVLVVSGQNETSNGCSGMIPGVPRVGFPGICLLDGPNGLHGAEAVNAYASAITVGASWNKDLALARGLHMGLEAKRKGVNSLLGPTVGPLGRSALGGRNWESFSVDPYLCGALGAQTTYGLQQNVIATAKHFIVNEQETNRNVDTFGMGNASVSVFVDDQTMHELYMWPFQDLLRAGVGSLMCSYNRINGSHGCQNSKTMNGLLKTEMAFQGFTLSDYGALHTGIAAINAGLDAVTPFEQVWGGNISRAVANGTMKRERLDDMVTRIVAAWYKYGKFEPGTGLPADLSQQHKVVSALSSKADETILQGAIEGIVLVKNSKRALPLRKPKILSLYGYDAQAPAKNTPEGPNTKYTLGYQSVNVTDEEMQGLFLGIGNLPGAARLGTLISGGGSPSVVPAYIDTPYNAFARRALEDKTFLLWDFESQDPVYANAASDACIVFINEFSAEGLDRSTLADAWSDELILNVASKCPNTIVSVHNAGTRLVDRWIEHPNVTAVLFAHLPGQDAGRSLVDIIYGEQSPSGRLPYTIPKNESDYGDMLYPALPDNATEYYTSANFTEGVFIDYRRFDALNITPRFEFGFGLSYTTFEYSDLSVNITEQGTAPSSLPPAAPITQGGLESLWDPIALIKASVRNIGNTSAAEVLQLYIGVPGAPVKQLRGFDKMEIPVGETRIFEFVVTRRDLSRWDVAQQNWMLQTGKEYAIYIGSSSRNIHLSHNFTL